MRSGNRSCRPDPHALRCSNHVLAGACALFQETVAGDISNLYILKLVNKTSRDIAVRLELRNSAGVVRLMGGSDSLTVDKGSSPKPRS